MARMTNNEDLRRELHRLVDEFIEKGGNCRVEEDHRSGIKQVIFNWRYARPDPGKYHISMPELGQDECWLCGKKCGEAMCDQCARDLIKGDA